MNQNTKVFTGEISGNLSRRSSSQTKLRTYAWTILAVFLLSFNSLGFAEVSNVTAATLPIKVTPADRSNGSVISIQAIAGSKIMPGVKQYRLCYMSDNLEVIGFLVMPENTTKKLPILIFNHGGTDEWSKIGVGFLDYFSEVSTKGPYIVLASQYRGIDGSQGKDEFGGKDLDDVLNLLPLAKHIPLADTSKIVMIGYSRGGIMTYEAIKAGMPLKAAAVVSGPTDLIGDYNETLEDIKANEIKTIGGTPTDMPDAYKARSAFYWPDKINVPVLIMHGDTDEKVSVTEAQKLSAKLDELKTPHKLIVMHDGHGLRHNDQQVDQLVLDWFAKYTAGP